MSRVNSIDLLFLLLESASRPMHMAAYQVFRIPDDYEGSFVHDLVAAYRDNPSVDPFNRVVKNLNIGIARWKSVDPDPEYHVRHLALPAPGSREQLAELVAFLNATTLDRSRPLWECYVIEGVADNSVAVLFKTHHALMDGAGGIKLFERSLSTDPTSREFKSFTDAVEKKETDRKSPGKKSFGLANLVPGLQDVAKSLVETTKSLADFDFGAVMMPFVAERTALNTKLEGKERSFGSCDLSLADVKAVGKAAGATVNDVVMTSVDMSLRRYLAEEGDEPGKPLRVQMPVSLRNKSGGGKGGNQVSMVVVELGEQGMEPAERLAAVVQSTSRIKTELAKLPAAAMDTYSTYLAAIGMITANVPWMDRLPSDNLLISNMPGPTEPLYLAGAPLVGFYGLPIVPLSNGLNVTFISFVDKICLSIGADPQAIGDPVRFVRYIEESLDELRKTLVKPKRSRKTTTGKKKLKTKVAKPRAKAASQAGSK